MKATLLRQRAPLTVALALGIASIVLWTLVAGGSGPIHGSVDRVLPGVRSFDAIFDPSQPLMVDEDEPTTFSYAVNKADFTVATPQYLPQNVPTSPEVWYSNATGEVAMRYGDQLVIEYVPWVSDLAPATEYQQMVEEWGTGEATEIAGNPAWVVPAGASDSSDPSVSEVYVAVNGVEMTFHGRIPIDELVKVAESLAPVEKVVTGLGT